MMNERKVNQRPSVAWPAKQHGRLRVNFKRFTLLVTPEVELRTGGRSL